MRYYKAEWMKVRFSVYLWAVLGIFASLSALGVLFLFMTRVEGGAGEETELFTTWNGLLALITALVFACFSILSAAISGKVIVEEYCGREAVILLSYPVRRRKLLKIKCTMVCGMTVVSSCAGLVWALGVMYVTSCLFQITPQGNTQCFVFTVLFSGILAGVSASAIGMISAVFGWKRRSAVAAVVCSLVIVCTVTNVIVIAPVYLMGIMLAMAAALVIIAGGMVHILAKRIEGMEV
ncbi:MAG: ABC transporter permease [Lachnospiraceae bacterium]|nr:ABC transporter permease [Lachnospiraceae bacterium]